MKTFLVIASAAIIAVLCILPATMFIFPLSWIARGSFVMDTMAHELGHSIYGWLFGYMNVPMIFTLFHADKMGGMAMMLGHSTIVQVGAVLALGFACYYIMGTGYSIPLAIFAVMIAAISISGYGMLVVNYMGHGNAIVVGGYLLYRAFAGLTPRGAVEKWLSAYFGFYLTLGNMFFSYRLMTDKEYLFDYVAPVEYIDHRDFIKVAGETGFTLDGVAMFTIALGAVMIILPAMLAFKNR